MVFSSCRLVFGAMGGQNPMNQILSHSHCVLSILPRVHSFFFHIPLMRFQSNHHTPRQLAQVNSVHITSTLTLVQLRDIIGQSCLTSFHTPSSLQQHQLFVLHPTQCTDNHNIKTQPQRKMRKENRKGTPDFDDRRSILVQSISPHTVPTLRRTPNQTARQRRQPSVKMHSIRASEDSG
ncbi:hypothetical protein BLNAU_24821 [Blattamonas nauphoetae]|uniref:Uncharacterized protein n=1 Tax=Blattamonas nauphoetae TaxID=2049346 RepID=A0ABQ9WP84_9EUKA|nr:hypothetical protein BLNAU_24821 [Blattamonas nauphoetae]